MHKIKNKISKNKLERKCNFIMKTCLKKEEKDIYFWMYKLSIINLAWIDKLVLFQF